MKELIIRALPKSTVKGVLEKMKVRSTATVDISIGTFPFDKLKETCRLVESELRTSRRSSRYYPTRPLNSLQFEGREEVTDPTPSDTEILHYASDRYSRNNSQRARSPPRFATPTRDTRGRSPSIKPRTTARRPGDPIPVRSRPQPTSTRARVHAIVPYDPAKNLDACLNCGNSGHRLADCKQPRDDNRIRSNLDLFQKHRQRLVATVNSMQTEYDSLFNQDSDSHYDTSEGEGSEFSMHTGDTTDVDTDQDEEDGSDLEYDHYQDEHGHTQDHNP